MIEEWRAVPGHPAYEVSNVGRVRSIDRPMLVRHPTRGFVLRHKRGQILRPGTLKSGHQFVVLSGGAGRLVHALVLLAFVGPRPEGMECCHWDDNPKNNSVDNLRWGTRAENVADFLRNYGRHSGAHGLGGAKHD